MRPITIILAALALAACSLRHIPDERVAAARKACHEQGGTFQRTINEDGSTNSMRCSVLER